MAFTPPTPRVPPNHHATINVVPALFQFAADPPSVSTADARRSAFGSCLQVAASPIAQAPGQQGTEEEGEIHPTRWPVPSFLTARARQKQRRGAVHRHRHRIHHETRKAIATGASPPAAARSVQAKAKPRPRGVFFSFSWRASRPHRSSDSSSSLPHQSTPRSLHIRLLKPGVRCPAFSYYTQRHATFPEAVVVLSVPFPSSLRQWRCRARGRCFFFQ